MHWDKPPPSGQPSTRPYQGVQVRDPVKELLRRKRGLDLHGTRSAPPAVGLATPTSQPSYTHDGQVDYNATSCPPSTSIPPAGSEGGGECVSWSANSPDPPATAWACLDYHQQHDPTTFSNTTFTPMTFTPTTFSTATFTPATLSYHSGAGMGGEVYMQPMGPSYTVLGHPSVLTYTHTPLLTNFGTIPMPSGSPHFPQVELQDVAYIPWAQPFTSLPSIPTLPTLSTLPSTGVQFSPCSPTLPGSLLPVPLALSSMTQPEPQPDPQSDPQPDPQILDEVLEVYPDQGPEPINPLEKLLDEQ